jgi:hypothetical protein
VNFNTWTELHRDGEVRILKLDYTVQQDAAIQHNEMKRTSMTFIYP